MADFVVTTAWIDELLTLATVEEQAAQVRAAGLLDEAGLSTLLDETETLMQQDPGQAHQLATCCDALADLGNAPAIKPRATYLRAQDHAIRGEFETARSLIETARNAYAQLGLPLEALRTHVGLMNVLAESGRFVDALAVGQSVLTQIDQNGAELGGPDSAELHLLTALIHASSGRAFCETGQYEASIDALARAEAIYQSLNFADRLASVRNDRGVILRYMGRISESLTAYEQAAATLPDVGYLRGVILSNMGDAQLLLGNYTQSLNAFAEARQQLAAVGALVDQQSCTLHMADAYLTLNLYPEALAAYQEVAAALRETDAVFLRGLALWGMGATLIAQADFQQAKAHLAQALTVFQSINNRPLCANVLLEQAALQAAQGTLDAARVTARQALELVVDSDSLTEWPVQAAFACMRMAELLLPDIDAAEAHLLNAERFAPSLSVPHLRYRLDQRLGHLRLRQGRITEAQRLLETSISEIERLRSTVSHEVMRTSFLHDKMAAYTDLVQLHLARAATEENAQDQLHQAFNVIERAKSRALVELIASTLDPLTDTASDADAARLLELQTELNAVYDELLHTGEGASDQADDAGDAARRVPTLQTRTAQIEQEINHLRLRTSNQASGVGLFEEPLMLTAIQAQIPADLCLLTYHILDEEIMAFVVTTTASHLIRHVSRTPVIQPLLQQLRNQIAPFRDGGFAERHMDFLERSTQRVLTGLYEALFAPVASQLADAVMDVEAPLDKLTIVPHGLLHQVPFHALYNGANYLLERYEISYAPSATIFTLTQRRTIATTGNALCVGIADPGIPAVAAELAAVAHELTDVTVLLNEQATRAAMLDLTAHARILHLACHGLFRTDNPMFSALKLYDSWLTGIDIAQLDLAGAFVVLSACESGRGQVVGGDEIIGLARAGLGAGASTLIVSQWLVQDDATAILMAELYAQLARGAAPVTALRAAQLALKSSHPHPYYWAPFVLMGNRVGFIERNLRAEL